MADVHWVPYGLMSPHRYLVFLSLGQGSTQGAISVKWRSTIGFDAQYCECHSELPRPNGWCPFSGTLWTHESTQVLWCESMSLKWEYQHSWANSLWHSARPILWSNPIVKRHLTEIAPFVPCPGVTCVDSWTIGFDHNIGQAECHSELPRPNGWCPFSGTLWTHESREHRYFGVPESKGKGVHRGRSPSNGV